MVHRIGVLGGMGPEATLYFLQLLFQSLQKTSQIESDQDYPDMTILMESTTPDRTEAIKDGTTEAANRINRAIASLVLSGCDPVVIPCMTAHALVEQRWFDAGVIDFRRCIIDHLESIYTGKIAILSTEGAIISNVFAPLAGHFELTNPSEAQQAKLMSIIYGPRGLKASNTDFESCKANLDEIIKHFQYQGVEYFLAGCTEIETFVSSQGMDDYFILPMAIMCEEVVERVKGSVLNE